MPDPSPALEAERSQILRQISSLGDLRPGSICAVARRCGKPTCHCAKPKDPGHDPQLRLTRKVDGKTVAESFASPAAFQKAQAEVNEYHAFKRYVLSWYSMRRFVVCALSRHSRESGAHRKKTAAAIHQEVDREIDLLLPRIFAERRKTGDVDMEAVELACRTTLHAAGAAALTELFQKSGPIQAIALSVRRQGSLQGQGPKPIVTVLGPEMLRAYYWCSGCRQGQFPADAACDIENMQLELPVAVGQCIPVMYVQMDATAVTMVAKETEGRRGKGADGRAHSRDAKLGCVFTQTTADAEDRPVRDEDSTTYTGSIEVAAEFSRRIYTEAHQRGWSRAQRK